MQPYQISYGNSLFLESGHAPFRLNRLKNASCHAWNSFSSFVSNTPLISFQIRFLCFFQILILGFFDKLSFFLKFKFFLQIHRIFGKFPNSSQIPVFWLNIIFFFKLLIFFQQYLDFFQILGFHNN